MNELETLQREYLDDLAESLKLIRLQAERLSSRDQFKTAFPSLLFMSHQIKGSGGSIGFPEVTNIARRMTQQLNRFLEIEEEARPLPHQLSDVLLSLTDEMEKEVGEQRARLG